MSSKIKLNSNDVLVVVDIQNDFCPGGALAVPHGDEIIPVVNRISRMFENVILTQDWHPEKHLSFASMHPEKNEYDIVQFFYGNQVLWPDHCVQGTWGAKLREDLDLSNCQLIIRKGFKPEIDSYSAFLENDHTTQTGLAGYLRERGIKRVFVVGLAYDYCVLYTTLDAVKLGFETYVIEDGCRAIGVHGSVEEALMKEDLGMVKISEADLVK
jgi:nicotinamidase/pyrazinamidase